MNPIDLEPKPSTKHFSQKIEEEPENENTRNDTDSPNNTETSETAELKSYLSAGRIGYEKACEEVLPEIPVEKKDAVDLLRTFTLQMSEKFDYYIDKTVANIKGMKKEINLLKKDNQLLKRDNHLQNQEIQQLKDNLDFAHDRISELEKDRTPLEVRQSIECFINQIFDINDNYRTSPGLYSQLSTMMLVKIQRFIKGSKTESKNPVTVKLLITNPNSNDRNRVFREVAINPNPNFPWINFHYWLQKNEDILKHVNSMWSDFTHVYENGKQVETKLSIFQECSINLHKHDTFTDKGYEIIKNKDAKYILKDVLVKFFSNHKDLQKMKTNYTSE